MTLAEVLGSGLVLGSVGLGTWGCSLQQYNKELVVDLLPQAPDTDSCISRSIHYIKCVIYCITSQPRTVILAQRETLQDHQPYLNYGNELEISLTFANSWRSEKFGVIPQSVLYASRYLALKEKSV